MYIYHQHHHHYATLSAWISLILFHHLSQSSIASGRSSGLLHPYRHRAAVYIFELVILPLHVHVKGSTGVHHL